MSRWSLLGGVAVVAAMLAGPTTARGEDLTLDPHSAEPPISRIWARADGPNARGDSQNWLWGPTIRSVTREPYAESPGGARRVYYFDKARMEITDPRRDGRSDWYATAGLLVREMIAGQIQVGDNTFIATSPAHVPLTGDLDNPNSPTYASLRPYASFGDQIMTHRAPPRIGETVTTLLRADSSIEPGAVAESDVVIGYYDETLGHNVPRIFKEWIDRQPIDGLFVTGHPLTEPFWVDTRVGGVEKRVLVQAFERRVLTYTPDNPDGWRVEAGNVGLHYRAWRGLTMPSDANLMPLASEVPYGEIIVATARRHGLDPYFLAALAEVSSGFNPLATMANGASGLFGVPEQLQQGWSYPLVPEVNAAIAAGEISRLRGRSDDWRAVLAWYYAGEQPNWDDPGLNAFVDGVLNTQARLIADLRVAPSPLAAELKLAGIGRAAHYSPSYTIAWWDNTIGRHAGWGNAVPGWERDPNGYYCVHPDFKPGQRLRLTANGVTLWCTIGDTVNPRDVAYWRSRFVVELSWHTFTALGLTGNNWVEVRYP